MFLKWVLTTAGFSLAGALTLAALNFLIKCIGLAPKPLENLLLTLASHNFAKSSVDNSSNWSSSTPLKENDLKDLFFLCSTVEKINVVVQPRHNNVSILIQDGQKKWFSFLFLSKWCGMGPDPNLHVSL